MSDVDIAARPDYGSCPVCDRLVQIRRNGAIRHHGGQLGRDWDGRNRRSYCCPGTGKPPKEATP